MKRSSPPPTAPSTKPRTLAAIWRSARFLPNPPLSRTLQSLTAIPKLASPKSQPPPPTSPPTASRPLRSPNELQPLCRGGACLSWKGPARLRNAALAALQGKLCTVPVALEDLTFHHGSIDLHAVAAGPPEGPVVLLLPGFPEFWYSWHKQIEPLATAGFRVIVPDQRGYNTSSKPRGAARYAVTELTSD